MTEFRDSQEIRAELGDGNTDALTLGRERCHLNGDGAPWVFAGPTVRLASAMPLPLADA
ncbi:hypothetical protein AB0M46_41305 [Dactylosporangium sp. NPDC051485]|uniref:hypothetical protein n=1 Tax=Dactylosporangium sp. NPDC051485 TaxID=3154846 RepID=UPI0034135A84